MTELRRQYFAWAVLSLVCLLLGHIVASLLGAVFGFLTTVLLQLADGLGLPDDVATVAYAALHFSLSAARCAMIGFAYRTFFDDPWRRAGLRAWAVIMVWSVLSQGRLPLSAWYLADAAVSGAAAFGGAWYALQQRHNQHVRSVRDGLLGFLRID